MTSNELISKYKSFVTIKTSEEDKLRVFRQIVKITPYINYDKKCELIEKLLLQDGKCAYAYIQKRFIECMLKYYTDIEILSDTYDILEEVDVLRYIILLFKTEYERCTQILNMYLDDIQSGRITYENLLSADK